LTAEKAPLYLASRGIYSADNLQLPLDQQSSHSNRNGIQMSCSSDSLLFCTRYVYKCVSSLLIIPLMSFAASSRVILPASKSSSTASMLGSISFGWVLVGTICSGAGSILEGASSIAGRFVRPLKRCSRLAVQRYKASIITPTTHADAPARATCCQFSNGEPSKFVPRE